MHMHGIHGMETLFNLVLQMSCGMHCHPSLPSMTTLRKLTFVKQP